MQEFAGLLQAATREKGGELWTEAKGNSRVDKGSLSLEVCREEGVRRTVPTNNKMRVCGRKEATGTNKILLFGCCLRLICEKQMLLTWSGTDSAQTLECATIGKTVELNFSFLLFFYFSFREFNLFF